MSSDGGVDGKCVYFWQLILVVGSLFSSALAVCNICQENQVACINSTSFYLCYGESTPNTNRLYHCKDGFDCTDLNVICIQSSSWLKPSCGDTSLCGACSAHRNHLFACHSRTTFQMCYGAIRPTGQIGYCPVGFFCDASSDAICVPEAEVDTLTCDMIAKDPEEDETSSSSSTSSTESSTASTTGAAPLTPNEVCALQQKTGLYPPVPRDPYCQSYIYCNNRTGVLRGIANTCSSGSYYKVEEERCTRNKPTYCL